MLIQPLVQQLQELRLRGMAAALEQQLATPDRSQLSFDERLGLMIQHEVIERGSARVAQRLRWARLPQGAVLEDLDMSAFRGLDPAVRISGDRGRCFSGIVDGVSEERGRHFRLIVDVVSA